MVSGSCDVDVDDEAEVGRQVAAHLPPGVAAVVAAHHVPVLLHEQDVGPGRVGGDVVDAVAHLGVGVGDPLRVQPLVDRPPVGAAVVAAERAGGGDGGDDPVGPVTVEEDRVQAQAAGAGLPARGGAVAPQPGQLAPGHAAVVGPEQGGVLHPGVDPVGVGRRRLEVPHPGELPRIRRAVVPLVRVDLALVAEVVADRVPRLAAVVGPVDDLAEPPARLRGVEPVRVGRRPLHVVDLPAAEVRPADVPVPAGFRPTSG